MTLDTEGGRTVSAYVRIREVKAAGCVQPRPNALIFLDVAEDGSPVGIRLLEQVDAVAVCDLLQLLTEGPKDLRRGVRFDPPRDARAVGAIVRALREALVGMQNRADSEPRSR